MRCIWFERGRSHHGVRVVGGCGENLLGLIYMLCDFPRASSTCCSLDAYLRVHCPGMKDMFVLVRDSFLFFPLSSLLASSFFLFSCLLLPWLDELFRSILCHLPAPRECTLYFYCYLFYSFQSAIFHYPANTCQMRNEEMPFSRIYQTVL